MFCRCRFDDSGPCTMTFDGGDRLQCSTMQGRRKVFEFERVYDPSTTQEKVYSREDIIMTGRSKFWRTIRTI